MSILTPVLTVADSADGTGGVATVASGTAGVTNTVSVVRWSGDPQYTDWTSAGSRSGNGTVTLALGKGYYWCKCVATSGTDIVVSNLVYFAVTNDEDAVHQQCVDGALARLQGMTFVDTRLPGGVLPPERILHQSSLDTSNLAMPAIVLIVPRQGTQEERGNNERDDVNYPVMVFLIERDARQETGPLPRLLKWREQIARAFRHQHLHGVTGADIRTCIVQDDHVINPESWNNNPAYQHIDSALILWFKSREVRGAGA